MDRFALLERAPLLETVVRSPTTGEVLEILKAPLGGDFGSLPADPARFGRHIDPRVAICGILSPYAARRCLGPRF